MQHIILLLLTLGLIALALTLTAIIKKLGRIKTVLPALLCLVILFVLLWYFTPAQYNLDENATITIIYTAKDTTINTDFEQNRELKSLIADLSYKRPFFNGYDNIVIQRSIILIGNLADGECRGGVRPALWLKLKLSCLSFRFIIVMSNELFSYALRYNHNKPIF